MSNDHHLAPAVKKKENIYAINIKYYQCNLESVIRFHFCDFFQCFQTFVFCSNFERLDISREVIVIIKIEGIDYKKSTRFYSIILCA